MLNVVKLKATSLWLDPLHRNSLFLMGSTAIMAAVGFFFWIVAARLYSQEAIGLAGSLISMSTLLATVATLGFPATLIRFLPTSKRPDEKVSTALLLTGLASVVVGLAFWVISLFILQDLHKLISSPVTWLIFCITIIIGAWQQLGDSIFIAFKRTKWLILQSIIYSFLKFCLVILFTSWLGFGIFVSNFTGMGIAILISYLINVKLYSINLLAGFSSSILKEVGRYSAGSYVTGLIGMFPTQVLPALVTTSLGPESAAHFFLALMMINLLLIIPQASSQMLFAAGSAQPDQLRALTFKSIKLQFGLIVTGITGIWLLGGLVLSFFGASYAQETTSVLRVLSLAVLPMSVSYPLTTRLKIKKQMRILTVLTASGAACILIACLIGSRYGLIGVATGYVIGQSITTIIVFTQLILSRR